MWGRKSHRRYGYIPYFPNQHSATVQIASCIVLYKEARLRPQGNVGLAGVKFTLEKATKAHRGSTGIALLFNLGAR